MICISTHVNAGGPQEDASWPLQRGNLRNSGLSPYDSGNNTGNLKWKYKADNRIQSSPVVDANGTIYMGSDDYNLYALNPNGTLKWKFLTGAAVVNAPAIDLNGIIYIGSLDSNFYAIYPVVSIPIAFYYNDHSLCQRAS